MRLPPVYVGREAARIELLMRAALCSASYHGGSGVPDKKRRRMRTAGMKKSCRYCGGTHPLSDMCPKKPERARRKKARREAELFRSTAAWTAKSVEIRERDFYCCRLCLAEGRLTTHDLSVHHIVPLMVDYTKRLDNSNLITLCAAHHSQADAGHISRYELAELASEPAKLK